MIRYALRCDNGHDFESWFRSSNGFEKMRGAGQVTCLQCGSAKVKKTLMAPVLPAGKKTETASQTEPALQKLREHIEKNSDYVGLSFADEARAMHEGDRPTRAIHGEANSEQARELIEDGVPIAPLPFIPRQKAN